MTIPELFNQELDFWIEANIKFLGVEPIDDTWDYAIIQESINQSCDKYWNTEKPCKLATNLNKGLLNKDASLQTKNSYQLKLNFYNMCIDVFGEYPNSKGELELKKICAIPTPCRDLCWIINRTHYVTRVAATKDLFGCVGKKDAFTVNGEGWIYSIDKDEFSCIITKDEYKFNPTIDEIFDKHLSRRSVYLLEAVLGEKLTKENFKKALKSLPLFDKASIFNYKFTRMEYFEDIVLNSKKYAQPTKDILLGKYGQTVKPFNPEVVDKVLGEDKKNAITCRPADLLEPELDKIEAEMKQYKQQDEDVLSYALFPQVATDFFKYREAQQTGVDAKTADTKNGAYPV